MTTEPTLGEHTDIALAHVVHPFAPTDGKARRLSDLRAGPMPGMRGPLVDVHGRVKRKLRLSVTDRCNFRCRYCMPERPKWIPEQQLLTIAELSAVARTFVQHLGIEEVRLTGGEPLVRGDLATLVAAMNGLRRSGLRRISLTTNGALLERRIESLRRAGLDDLNVSLDAWTPAVFRALTGSHIDPVLRGIAASRDLPLKINTVVIRGYNDQEIVPLARWALEMGLTLRFIEFMPLDGRQFWTREKVVTEDEIVAALSKHFTIERLPRGVDPATPYRLETGRLGIISTISRPFCADCDRIRVAATGTLYPCLFSSHGIELAGALRAGREALTDAVRGAVWHKDAGYVARPGYPARRQSMHQLGG